MNQDAIVAGEDTIFVLGNGPSLGRIDLRDLRCASIGMNAAYRHWDRIDWRPTHYACLDLVVGLSHLEGIRGLLRETREDRIRSFLLRSNAIGALGPDAEDDRVLNFDALRSRTPLFQFDLVTTGSHAALWAAQMGFRTIVILGVDGHYREIVDGAVARKGNVLEIKDDQTANPNYFFADYQQPGDLYHVPNPMPGLHLNAWRGTAATLAGKDVRVVNGNPKSEVRAFPFVDAGKLIQEGRAPLSAPADDPAPFDLSAHERRFASPRYLGQVIASKLPGRSWHIPAAMAAVLGLLVLGLGSPVFAEAIRTVAALVFLIAMAAACLVGPEVLRRLKAEADRQADLLALAEEANRQLRMARRQEKDDA